MNWYKIESNWSQAKAKLKERWGKLTDDQFNLIAGKRERLLIVLQQSYGLAKDEAERQIKEWERNVERFFGEVPQQNKEPQRKVG